MSELYVVSQIAEEYRRRMSFWPWNDFALWGMHQNIRRIRRYKAPSNEDWRRQTGRSTRMMLHWIALTVMRNARLLYVQSPYGGYASAGLAHRCSQLTVALGLHHIAVSPIDDKLSFMDHERDDTPVDTLFRGDVTYAWNTGTTTCLSCLA